MEKILIIIAVIVVIIIIGAVISFSYIDSNHKKQIDNMVISNVDITKIADGTYTGNCEVFPVSVEVKVTVKNHKITGIELVKHVNGKGAKAETIINKVVEAQTLQVDIVTGATSSSKVILKAIENALTSAIK